MKGFHHFLLLPLAIRIIFVLCFFACKNLYAQDAFSNKFNYHIYKTTDGLPDGYLHGIMQDSRGYLWIRSVGGLSRYDGSNFVNYSLKDGLPGMVINATFEDTHHRLWVSSANKICYLNGEKFIKSLIDSNFIFNNIVQIFQIKNDVYANTEKGLLVFKNHQWVKSNFLNKEESKEFAKIEWLGGDSVLLLYVSQLRLKTKNENRLLMTTSGDTAFHKILARNNEYYVSTNLGMFKYSDGKKSKLYPETIGNQTIFDFMVDSKNRLWCATDDKGVFIFEKSGYELFDLAKISTFTLVNGMIEDNEGHIWMGSFGGLIKFNEPVVETFNHLIPVGIIVDSRTSTIDSKGKLYFAKAGGVLAEYENDSMKFIEQKQSTPFLKELYEDYIISFNCDEYDSLWITTTPGNVVKYKNGKFVDYTVAYGTPGWIIYNSAFNPHDSAFYFTTRDGLLKIKNYKKEIFDVTSFGDSIHRTYQVKCDKRGFIFFLNKKKECFIYDGKVISKISEPWSNVFLRMSRIYIDNDNRLWVGTLGEGVYGLNISDPLRPKELLHLTTANGLPLDNILSMCVDKSGYLWLGTNIGVVRVDIRKPKPDGSYSMFRFTEEQGAKTTNWNDINLVPDLKGDVWASTIEGVLHFKSAKIPHQISPPNIVIENIKNGQNYVDGKTKAVLNFNENNLSFYFKGVTFTNAKDVQYSYMLDGNDMQWSNPVASNFVIYNNLKPGDYIFKVRSRIIGNDWNIQPATFSFTVKPPVWETWWFRILLIVVSSGLIIFLFRLRVSQIQKREEAKAQVQNQMQQLEMRALKSQMNPHFIYNALNSIQSFVVNDQPDAALKYTSKFGKLLRMVLNNSEKQFITLESEIEALKLYIEIEKLRIGGELDYKIDVDDEVNEQAEMVPPLIIQPYVENSLWHGLSLKENNKKLSVAITTDENNLIVEVTDNGIGRKKAQEIKSKKTNYTASKAMNITQSRLSLLQKDGEQNVVEIIDLFDENNEPAGTKVIITMPRTKL
ncbi:MAG: histidine kinase [Bacteroidia bacterium]